MKDGLMDLIISGESASSKTRGMTARSLLISICVSFGLFVAYVVCFSLLRKKLRSVYEPRTFIVARHMRTPPSSDGFFDWILATLRSPLSEIPETVGLDAYFFLRYLLFTMILSGAMALPMLAILLPLHLTGNNTAAHSLDRATISHISSDQSQRHIAHLVCCAICTTGALLLFKYELTHYFRMRAKHILSYDDAVSPSSTLLIKGLHPDFQTEESITLFFSGLAGNANAKVVERVWFNKDYSKLHGLVQAQGRVLDKIERHQLLLIERCLGVDVRPSERRNFQNNNKDSAIVGNLWREYLSPNNLALMDGREGSLLTWLKGELSRLNSQVFVMQSQAELLPSINSCFVKFTSKHACFIASRSLGSGKVMSPGAQVHDRIYPKDIIWSNLTSATWLDLARICGAVVLNYTFIFGWAFPVALVSMFTQVEVMSQWMPQIHWLVRTPKMTQLMSNVLSPLIVSSLASQVPTFFRLLARLKGYPTKTLVEIDVQKYLFLFMFFQLFLIVTLATGLPSLMVKFLLNTSEGAITLASSLPKAATFFTSYLLASCLTTSGNALLQSQQLLLWAWDFNFAKTPRQILQSKCRYSTLYWGALFPVATNTAAIAIAYALISPIILISAIIGLATLFVAFKYRILYCYVPRCIADGDYYPRAIFQLFSGIYCQEISLLGTLLVSQQLGLAFAAALCITATFVSHRKLRLFFLDMNNRIPLPSDTRFASTKEDVEMGSVRSHSVSSPASAKRGVACESPSKPDTRDEFVTSPYNPTSLSELSSPDSILTRAESNQPTYQSAQATPSTPDSISTEGTLVSQTPGEVHQIQESANAAIQDTWMGLFDTVASDFKSLTPGQQEYVSSQLFEHPDRRLQRPCVWLPRDPKGVAFDQVMEMQHHFTDLRASCSGVEIDAQGTITISQAPPDFDPRELMRI